MTGLEIGSCTVERGSGTPPTAQPSVADTIVRSPSTVPGRSVAVMAADVHPFGGASAVGGIAGSDESPHPGPGAHRGKTLAPSIGTSCAPARAAKFRGRPSARPPAAAAGLAGG